MNLVEFKNGFPVTDSQVVAREFGMKHAYLMRIIESVLDDYPDLRVISNHPKTLEIVFFEMRIYRGKEFQVAIMNRPFFTLLVGRLETKHARQKQREFNAAFYEMENRLLQYESNKSNPAWLDTRKESKLIRRAETDVIQQFVDYAVAQGSENAKFYYKHITNATYKALGIIQHKEPKLRDTLAILETSWLISAEHVARQSLLKHMADGAFYKDIFKLVKTDIELFAGHLYLPVNQIEENRAAYLP
jgi:phage regulator Rha-like protein